MNGNQTATQQDLTMSKANALCEALLRTTNELIELLDEETRLLRKANTAELSSMSVRKDALSATLTHHMDKFKTHTQTLRSLVPGALKTLEAQRLEFQKSIESNHAALIAMQAVSERILQTVADKVSRQQSGPEVYTNGGQMTRAGVKRSAAINVDTAL